MDDTGNDIRFPPKSNGANGANGSGKAFREDPDAFDFRAAASFTITAARQHWVTVCVTCFITLFVVTVYVYVWPPLYVAKASIMLEKDSDPSRDAFFVDWNVFRKTDARTELQLMTSANVLVEVIERENLSYDDVYHPIMSQLSYFWNESWPGRTYKSLKNRLLGRHSLLSPEQEELGKTLNDLRASVSIRPEGDSYVATLTMVGPSQRVASMANTLLDVYLEQRIVLYRSEAQDSYDALSQEVAAVEVELRAIEQRRLAYAAEHGVQIDLQLEILEIKQLADLDARIAQNEETIASLGSSLVEVKALLAIEKPTRTINSRTELNATRQAMKLKRLEYQTALVQATDLYREDSPEVRELRRDLAEFDTLLASEPEHQQWGTTEGLNTVWERLVGDRNSLLTQLAGARASLDAMLATADRLHTRLASLPILQTQLHNLNREYNYTQQKHQTLALRRAQAEVSITTSDAAPQSLRVAGYARPPASQYWPKLKILYPSALIVGLCLGVIAAVAVMMMSGRVSKVSIENSLGATPLYGTVSVACDRTPLRVVPRAAASSTRL